VLVIPVSQRLITLQLGITLAAVALLYALGRIPGARSAAIGGGIGLAATLAGAMVLRPAHGQSPAALLRSQLLAEALKVSVTLGLFMAAFLLIREIAPLPLFTTYAATLAAYGIVLFNKTKEDDL
jgi:ATP synthase protein I